MKKAFKWGIVAAVAVAIIAAIIAVVLVVLMKNKEDNSVRKWLENLSSYRVSFQYLQIMVDPRRQHWKVNQGRPQDLEHQPGPGQLCLREPQGPLRSSDQSEKTTSEIESKTSTRPRSSTATKTATATETTRPSTKPSPTGATLSTRASTSTEQSSTSLETTSASISTEQASTKPLQTTTSGTDQSQKTTSEIESKTSTRPRSSSASKTTIPTTTTSPSTKYTTNPTSSLSLQPSEPTEPPSPTPTLNPNGLYCLLVGDMYNFNDKAAYEWEAIHIEDIGMFFFRESPISKIGLWAYGHTDYPKTPDLNRMSSNYREHRQECGNMKYRHRSDPLTTSRKDTHSLPQLNPQNKTLKRIVAIGHNTRHRIYNTFGKNHSTKEPYTLRHLSSSKELLFIDNDLSEVAGPNGIAVTTTILWDEQDYRRVMDAIMGSQSKPDTSDEE
ncbi:hypothetical protein ANCCEY_09058 [Ancylostoma ceylanicum]|uniref:Uncharacterized protein n=1 Tax=Ancylostoma ceylanicum TaxID=53326 RepID=A0A0D6LIG3_9BILA|nr:hypothetical protein ANCCEY_09058 [Ancylostoma ceylanicum]